MNKPNKSQHSGGRKPKIDPANHRYTINLTSDENFRFRQMFDKSGMDRYSKFIKAVLFKREIKVIKVDKTTLCPPYRFSPTIPSHRQQLQSNSYGFEDELRGEKGFADDVSARTENH